MHLNSLCMTATGEVFASVQQVTLAIVQCITTACLNRIHWCKWVSSICIVLNLLTDLLSFFPLTCIYEAKQSWVKYDKEQELQPVHIFMHLHTYTKKLAKVEIG